MTPLQSWLSKPRAKVRIDTAGSLTAWIKRLQRSFERRQAARRPGLEVIDRISLGGKKSLLLISIEGRRAIVGVGESGAPAVSVLEPVRVARSERQAARRDTRKTRRRVR